MSIILTPEDEEELWQESYETTHWSNGWEESYHYPKQLGTGYTIGCTLRDGLDLKLRDYELQENVKWKDIESPVKSTQMLSFFVAGNINTVLHGLTNEVSENAGGNYFASTSGLKETEEWFGGQRYVRVKVMFETDRLFGNLGGAELAQLPPKLRQIIETGTIKPHYRQGVNTPAIQAVLQQILHCPYQDLMKRMYLESRAQDLIVLQFTQFAELNTATAQPFLKPDDIDRIHQARDILICHLDQPPSLLELARQVKLNDCKLKQGFRQIFGTTVFGYFRDYRMERSRQLLQNQEMTISGVAAEIGYASTTSFADAFKRKFGISPKAYQLTHRKGRQLFV
ncbi:helix-turn-helix transcriptional regulator [Myxacorys almedinensis]|uniref:Helix-turn-helix domain-containing protein n=1 Tax=Myxacorys almedinensis A TaxID=2690445 RepID=A0A8J7ZBD5_9CYAN|nr:AraC family transcriptional regulator [Myxacorys almedinensis]NDJ18855.1 helix-turn-helix domain-containing protein [Myxacorys almedinensis A]